ncbi:MAG TPA: RIP metalloprotease RseP [Bacteroidetes bacterium]|nr:RIP metalloprotease RseP [Bacteroidota bacterium]
MIVLIKTVQLILSLSILVLIHEFGHFITARWFKTKVEKFYLFFDPWFALFKFRKGETEYGVGWLPLGGYVKIAGMIDESMDKEQMKQPPQPWEFRSKPAWQRLIIMLGGIIMNMILAIFIYSMILFAWGEEYIPNANLQYGIAVDSTAMHLGLQSGDHILSVGGKPIEQYTDVFARVMFDGERIIEVERAGEKVDIKVEDSSLKYILNADKASFIEPRTLFFIDSLPENSPAGNAGIKAKDQLIALDSIPALFWDQAVPYIVSHKGKTVAVTLLRSGDTLKLPVKISEDGTLGVYRVLPDKLYQSKKIAYGFWASIPAGWNKTWEKLADYVKQFRLIFNRKTEGYKHLGGFISIGKIMTPTWDWQSFWNITAFLSLALAFMNLLPIPALDGGHVLFTLVEMITGRKPSDKFLEYAQVVGMVILLSLMVYANGNDIIKLFK